LLLPQPKTPSEEAETWGKRALDVAPHQEAHDLLAPIYGWFTAGCDTADLQQARALLWF
jgi:hypothetical protein